MNIKLFAKGIVAGAKKNAPTLLVVGGLITGGAALVTACIQSTKLNDILDESKAEMDKRQQAVEDGKMMKDDETGEERQYTQEDADHDKRALYFRTALRIAKLYAIPAVLSAISIAMILTGNKMHRARTAQAIAVGNAAVATLNSAKERAKEVIGEEKTREIFDNVKKTGEKVKVEREDEEGHVGMATEDVKTGIANNRTSFIFNEETSTMWSKTHFVNQKLFADQENSLNDLFYFDGAVTIDQALKKLGLVQTGKSDGWTNEAFGGYSKGIFVTATLLDPRTEEYLLEFNIEGDISEYASKVYMAAAKNIRHK